MEATISQRSELSNIIGAMNQAFDIAAPSAEFLRGLTGAVMEWRQRSFDRSIEISVPDEDDDQLVFGAPGLIHVKFSRMDVLDLSMTISTMLLRDEYRDEYISTGDRLREQELKILGFFPAMAGYDPLPYLFSDASIASHIRVNGYSCTANMLIMLGAIEFAGQAARVVLVAMRRADTVG